MNKKKAKLHLTFLEKVLKYKEFLLLKRDKNIK